jgi:hypothetical protein
MIVGLLLPYADIGDLEANNNARFDREKTSIIFMWRNPKFINVI